MIQKLKLSHILLIVTLFVPNIAHSYDNAHFYRARLFFYEPRLQKDFLSSFDVLVAKGSTCKGIGCCNCCDDTCLLDICGCHDMQFLGKNVPNKDLTREGDVILHQLAQIPAMDNFARLSFSGEFKISELVFSYHQNFTRGFFFHLHVPFREIELHSINYRDLCADVDENCTSVTCPHIETANTYWQAFLNMFNQILKDHGLLFKKNVCCRSIGDVSVVLGYTINYEDTEFLDFVDATIRAGIILPTSKKRNENIAFSIPIGYNGHTGLFGECDVALGIYDWVTIGSHVNVKWFNRKCQCIRIKTSCEQNSFIKLAKDIADVKHGNIYNVGAYFRADHVVAGLSLLVGYSYSMKKEDELSCFRNECTDCQIASTDCQRQEWRMHTLHLLGEYDFTKENHRFGPRINAFYNFVLGGRRVFKTGVGGVGIGVDIVWN